MSDKLLTDLHFEQIKEFIPSWKALENHEIQLKRLTGITNITMKASHLNKDPSNELIVRRFGKAEQCCYLDRDREDHVLKFLGTTGIGPKLYGANKQIRLEQFIHSKSLQSTNTLEESTLVRIGYQLHLFHSSNPDFLDKTPLIQKICIHPKYLDEAKKKWGQPIYSAEEQHILNQIKSWLCEQQLLKLNQELKALNEDVVFSHNDLLIGNILVRDNQQILFIDYEYACYNYRSFDFGNYFLESMYDYDVQVAPFFTVKPEFPTSNTIKRMIGAYLLTGTINKEQVSKIIFNEQLCEEIISQNPSLQEQLAKMIKSIPYMMMSSCVFWGIWAIYKSKDPQISFDYIAFCKTRRDLYYRIKKELL